MPQMLTQIGCFKAFTLARLLLQVDKVKIDHKVLGPGSADANSGPDVLGTTRGGAAGGAGPTRASSLHVVATDMADPGLVVRQPVLSWDW